MSSAEARELPDISFQWIQSRSWEPAMRSEYGPIFENRALLCRMQRRSESSIIVRTCWLHLIQTSWKKERDLARLPACNVPVRSPDLPRALIMQDTRELRLYSNAMNEVPDSKRNLHTGNKSSPGVQPVHFTQDTVYYNEKLTIIITKVSCRPSEATTQTSGCAEAHKWSLWSSPHFSGRWCKISRIVQSRRQWSTVWKVIHRAFSWVLLFLPHIRCPSLGGISANVV